MLVKPEMKYGKEHVGMLPIYNLQKSLYPSSLSLNYAGLVKAVYFLCEFGENSDVFFSDLNWFYLILSIIYILKIKPY